MTTAFKLLLYIDRAEGLVRRANLGADGNPYIKTYVDDKLQKQESVVRNHTIAPTWQFTARFASVQLSSTVFVKVYDHKGGMFGKDRSQGQVQLRLSDVYIPGMMGMFRPFEQLLVGQSTGEVVSGKVYYQLCFLPADFVGTEPMPMPAGLQRQIAQPQQFGNWGAPNVQPVLGLPEGWEARRDTNGRIFYVDHVNRRTQWELPLAPATAWTASADINLSQNNVNAMMRSMTLTPAQRGSMDAPALSRGSMRPVSMSNPSTPVQALFVPAQSQPEEPLPQGWERRMTSDGRIFFIDHNFRRSQWEDPRTGRIPEFQPITRNNNSNAVPAAAAAAAASPVTATAARNPDSPGPLSSGSDDALARETRLGALPHGWEMRYNMDGTAFFIDHVSRSTQWEDPRLNPQQLAEIERRNRELGVVTPKVTPKYISDYQSKLVELRKNPALKVDMTSKVEIRIRRSCVFEDSFAALSNISAVDLKRRVWIRFDGEDGLDYGGLAREWFHLLSKEMFNPYYCLFEYSANDNYTLQISPNSGVNNNHLAYFYFVGRIVGMAVFHSKFVDAFFVSSFYKRMLGQESNLADMQSFDPEKYQSLTWMLENDITDVLFETFTATEDRFGQSVEVELKPNGKAIDVTNENKAEYVKLYVQWRSVRGTEEQFAKFMKGFYEFLPAYLMSPFDAKELEYLIGGLADIDVDDWEANTIYKNYNMTDKVIRWFWLVVRKLNSEQRCRLLQFATGTSRVPATGFKDLWGSDGPRKFCVEKWGTPQSLPRAHTCFNRIDLPPYDRFETLESKLLFALEQSDSFGVE